MKQKRFLITLEDKTPEDYSEKNVREYWESIIKRYLPDPFDTTILNIIDLGPVQEL